MSFKLQELLGNFLDEMPKTLDGTNSGSWDERETAHSFVYYLVLCEICVSSHCNK